MALASNTVGILAAVGLIIVAVELVLYISQRRRKLKLESVSSSRSGAGVPLMAKPIVVAVGVFCLILGGVGTVVVNYAATTDNAKLTSRSTLLESAYYRLSMANKLGAYFTICPDVRAIVDSLQPAVDSIRMLAFVDTMSCKTYHLYHCTVYPTDTIFRLPVLSKMGSADSAEAGKVYSRHKIGSQWTPWDESDARFVPVKHDLICEAKFDAIKLWEERIQLPHVDGPTEYQFGVTHMFRGWSQGYPPSVLLEDFSAARRTPKVSITLCLNMPARICEAVSFAPGLGDSLRTFDQLVRVLMHSRNRSLVVAHDLAASTQELSLDIWQFAAKEDLIRLLTTHDERYTFETTSPGRVVGVGFQLPVYGNWEEVTPEVDVHADLGGRALQSQ